MQKQNLNLIINGQNVIDWASQMANGYCYFHLTIPDGNGNDVKSQVEVVVNEEGLYNGYTQKWTNFILFSDKMEDLYELITFLRNQFGSGNYFEVTMFHDNGSDYYEENLFDGSL